MTKRLIDLDDELLADVQAAIGTAGVSNTVRTALRLAIDAVARTRQVDLLTSGGLAELEDPEALAAVWR